MKPALSIVVPCHNEAENLPLLIPQLVSALSPLRDTYEIIVVDNASTDNTQEIVRTLHERFPSVRAVSEPEKGFGNAILRGLRESSGDVIGYIHADNQMSSETILRIYHKLIQNKLDICKATRINRHDGFVRFVITKVYNLLFRLMFSVTQRDINGSPKLFTRSFYEKARLESRDWFIDPEIIIKAKRMGAKIDELEIITFRRKAGVSQVRMATVMEFIRNMFYHWWHINQHNEKK